MVFIFLKGKKTTTISTVCKCFMSIEHHKFSNQISLSILEVKYSLKVYSARTTYISEAYRISLKENRGLHGFYLYLVFLTVLLPSCSAFTLSWN